MACAAIANLSPRLRARLCCRRLDPSGMRPRQSYGSGAVAGECELTGARRTPRPGGPSRRVPTRLPRVTGIWPVKRARRQSLPATIEAPKRWVGLQDEAPSACAPKLGSLKRQRAHRGFCGASLKHRARDAGRTADLRIYNRRRPRKPLSASAPRGAGARGSHPHVAGGASRNEAQPGAATTGMRSVG